MQQQQHRVLPVGFVGVSRETAQCRCVVLNLAGGPKCLHGAAARIRSRFEGKRRPNNDDGNVPTSLLMECGDTTLDLATSAWNEIH